MKYFLFFSFVLISNVLFAQRNDYAVLKKGDTVSLTKKAYIDVNYHSQIVRYRDSNNKKRKLYAADVTKLYIKDFEVYCNSLDKASHFETYDIITKKGNCTHFCNEVYKNDSITIYVSPYCERVSNLYLYIKTEDGKLKSINKSDYKNFIDRYFSNEPQIVKLKDRRYDSWRLLNALKKLQ